LDKARYIKLCELVRRLRKSRRAQAKKIDILCNDMVEAHGDFVKRLRALNFGVSFYESILGRGDLRSLLDAAANCIKNHVSDSNVVVFLCECEGHNHHIVDENKPVAVERRKLESYFTPEMVEKISRATWVCSLNDMFEMGLEGDLGVLNRISAAGVPIRQHGPGLGFVLIYRSVEHKLTPEEMEGVAGVMSGLSRAIESCKLSAATTSVS
jgi:hypothetical protein